MKKMKISLLCMVLMCLGCLPATQQEILQLTTAVSAIVPAVEAAVLNESEETQEEIGVILGRVTEINEAVATAEGPIEAIESGWNASEPFNPYYGYGAAAIALIKLFFDNKKKKETETKYAAAKIGIEKFRNDNPSKSKELYSNIGEARKAKNIT